MATEPTPRIPPPATAARASGWAHEVGLPPPPPGAPPVPVTARGPAAHQRAATNGKAVGGLVCVAVSWFTCGFPLAVVGVVLATLAGREIARSDGAQSGGRLVTAAKVAGWVHIAFALTVAGLFAALLVAGGAATA